MQRTSVKKKNGWRSLKVLIFLCNNSSTIEQLSIYLSFTSLYPTRRDISRTGDKADTSQANYNLTNKKFAGYISLSF